MTAIDEPRIVPSVEAGTPDTLEEMIKGIAATAVAAGTPLARQGEQSEGAFVLVEGTVRVVADTAYGAVPLATISCTSLDRRDRRAVRTTQDGQHHRRHRAQGPCHSARAPDRGRAENPQFLVSVITQLGKQLDGMNRTLSLYSNALTALEKREFDPRILEDLANPSPQLAEFSAAFRNFAHEIVGKRRSQDELASAAIIQQSYLPKESVLDERASCA